MALDCIQDGTPVDVPCLTEIAGNRHARTGGGTDSVDIIPALIQMLGEYAKDRLPLCGRTLHDTTARRQHPADVRHGLLCSLPGRVGAANAGQSHPERRHAGCSIQCIRGYLILLHQNALALIFIINYVFKHSPGFVKSLSITQELCVHIFDAMVAGGESWYEFIENSYCPFLQH